MLLLLEQTDSAQQIHTQLEETETHAGKMPVCSSTHFPQCLNLPILGIPMTFNISDVTFYVTVGCNYQTVILCS